MELSEPEKTSDGPGVAFQVGDQSTDFPVPDAEMSIICGAHKSFRVDGEKNTNDIAMACQQLSVQNPRLLLTSFGVAFLCSVSFDRRSRLQRGEEVTRRRR